MVCIYVSVIAVTVTHFLVTRVWEGFYPLITDETYTGIFCSSFLFVYLLTK